MLPIDDAFDTDLEAVLAELLGLRRAVAECLGREQYLYRLLDDAIESQHLPAMRRALSEFNAHGGEAAQTLHVTRS